MTVVELNSNHLWFDINSAIETEVKREASNYPGNYNRAYLNLLSQKAILPYLKEDYADAKLAESYTEFWQLGINGTIISINNKKLALIPSEASDIDELRVDREWVDIPELAADYFLGVQVDTKESIMRVWGYTTHKELKERGTYTERDRSYSLAREDITEEINTLWLTSRHFPDRVTQAEIAPIPELETSNSIRLTNRLANSEIIFPRRMVDFAQWSQLVNQKKRRDELIKSRYFHIKISRIIDEQLTIEQLNGTIAEFERIFNSVEEPNQQNEGVQIIQELLKENKTISDSNLNSEVLQLEKLAEELITQVRLASVNSLQKPDREIIRRWSVRSFIKAASQTVQVDTINAKLDQLVEPIGWLLVGDRLSTAREHSRESDKEYLKLPITIAGEEYELNIKSKDISQNSWIFELCKADRNTSIFAGLKFRLLDEHGEEFENNERVAVEGQKALVFEELEFEAGEGVIWEIEPTPDRYQREIIYF